VGFLLIAVAAGWFLPSFTSKWPLVVMGFLLLPLAWSFHYLVKIKFSWREPAVYLWLSVGLGLISSALAANPYLALRGWLVFLAGVVVYFLVRSLTPEHRQPLMIGIVIVGVVIVGWSYLATKTSLSIPWVPVVSKDPLLLTAAVLLPLACAIILLIRAQGRGLRVLFAAIAIFLVSPWVLPSTWQAWHSAWAALTQQMNVLQQIFSAHPLVGVGSGNYTFYFPRFASNASVYAEHAPSSLVDAIVGFGILPIAAFLVFLFFSIQPLVAQKAKMPWVYVACLGLLGAVACVVFVDHPAVALSWPILFGLMSSPFITQEGSSQETRRIFRRSLLVGGWVVALLSLAMGFGINRFGRAERAAQSGDTKSAASLYASALHFDADPMQRRAYAESLWLNGHQKKDLAEAEHQARLAYQWNREDTFAYQVAARIAFSEGNNAEAERLYKEVLQRDRFFSLDAAISLADVYKKQGKKVEEQQLVEQTLAPFTVEVVEKGFAFSTISQQLEQIKKRLVDLKK
jgi:tetratricopeptide (TPR) repeat protein